MNPIIKWPGGKSREIGIIESLIPAYTGRYIEPFFGGGALFFYLEPEKAAINDISKDLMLFYLLIRDQDPALKNYLMDYNSIFEGIIGYCNSNIEKLVDIFSNSMTSEYSDEALRTFTGQLVDSLDKEALNNIVISNDLFVETLFDNAKDKIKRTVENNKKQKFSHDDLCENLKTGFTSGCYMYFRSVFNDIGTGRLQTMSNQYKIANYYFIREYCYGSMFRYNSKGEFNIPYGGMSYNKKKFSTKINNMFNDEISKVFKNTDIHCEDFESFLNSINCTEDDFMFLDPPYDTDFSDYEGKDFTKNDQVRLAEALKKTKAKFILVIKNTEFIFNLYKDNFNILSFDKQYTYNVRSRNDRDVEHLVITNLLID